jgi:NAD(P)-dependent dehydrogenase (short-subunit alcohol dehydrogenase family)
MEIFREGLLGGRSIALAGPVPAPVKDLLEALDARVYELPPEPQQCPPLDALVCAETGAEQHLLASTWAVVHAVATETFIPANEGRIVLLASSEDASVVKAALENLARTLSVEWARYRITTTSIAPGPDAAADEIANLIAYLISPAGAYFSGCRFDVG